MRRATTLWVGWQDARDEHVRSGPERDEQRRQTAQSVLALRVALLFRLSFVARRLQTAAGMRPPRALERRKIYGNAA
jgi:hypothetical protein